MSTKKTLDAALKEILAVHPKASKFDAEAICQLILADNRISDEENEFLHNCLDADQFDEKGKKLLHELLLRAEARI